MSTKSKKRGSRMFGDSSDYRRHWQYLIAASRITSALSLATLFSVIAIVTKFTDLVKLGKPALYFFIAAVGAYGIAILVIKFRAPAFLQEYPDYKSFDDKKHSHRWVLWEFHTNLTALEAGFELLSEAIEKKLCVKVTKPPARSRLPVTKTFAQPFIAKNVETKLPSGATQTCRMHAHYPLNFDRDLIVGFTIKSYANKVEEKYILAIREDDPKLDPKCKELFWMILTAAAKEHPRSRLTAWILVQVSVLLLIAALILAVFHSVLAQGSADPVTTWNIRYI